MNKNDKYNIAVYPGSFDPPTNGHIDMISRASFLFRSVIVAVANNENKNHMFSLNERICMLKKSVNFLKNIKIISFSGLIVDFLENINSFVIIRGLRILSDFEYEFQMALMNKKLNKKIETVFLISNQSHTFLSSSIIKEIASFGGDISEFVHEYVNEKLKKHFFNFNKKNVL
jgi:pantetheine-phosphate adenylyltransferase